MDHVIVRRKKSVAYGVERDSEVTTLKDVIAEKMRGEWYEGGELETISADASAARRFLSKLTELLVLKGVISRREISKLLDFGKGDEILGVGHPKAYDPWPKSKRKTKPTNKG